MTIADRLQRDRQRLNDERARDALFEATSILAELKRDQSLSRAVWRALEFEIERLQPPSTSSSGLALALALRDRVRSHYALGQPLAGM